MLLDAIYACICDWLCQIPPHMYTMAKNGFHHQLIAPLINKLITTPPLAKADWPAF